MSGLKKVECLAVLRFAASFCCADLGVTVFHFGLIFLSLFCASRAPSQADAPNTGLIPESDAVGVTVVLITCTYRGQEFIRIGYYVNNEYTDPELRENPPLKPDYTQVIHTHTHTHTHGATLLIAATIGIYKAQSPKHIFVFNGMSNYALCTAVEMLVDAMLYHIHCFLLPSGALKAK